MKARVVIGANFGDEGKGLVTDWLCRQGAGMVVRFNGGAQAGHTVIDVASGRRHVFSHFGSGTFTEVPTYLSEFFVVNPILFEQELGELIRLGLNPVVYAHPKCLVTTFADMWINQQIEIKRGKNRHGSVGLGINETIMRSTLPEIKITMGDIWDNPGGLKKILEEICGKYAKFRAGESIPDPDKMISAFIRGCEDFANKIHPLGIQQCEDPVFEGAQGLLLDQNNKEFFPHLTRSNTGMQNVRELVAQAGISDIETFYVSRTYLTRHGAGPLPGEDPNMKYEDDTNLEHPFQGTIRFAPLNLPELHNRCRLDCGGPNYKLVLTHMDQLSISGSGANFEATGPTANDISSR